MSSEAAFFDLDKTLLPGSSLFPLARELYRQRFFDLGDIARMALDQLAFRVLGAENPDRIERARDASLEAISGRRPEEVIEVGRSVAEEEIIPRLYPQAVELVSRHRVAGREVYLCSSSPQDFIALLASELGMDGVVGTRAEIEGDRYTGRLEGALCHAEEKARRVRKPATERQIGFARAFP